MINIVKTTRFVKKPMIDFRTPFFYINNTFSLGVPGHFGILKSLLSVNIPQ